MKTVFITACALCLPTFSLQLIRRNKFFIDNFGNQVKRFRSTVAQLIVAC